MVDLFQSDIAAIRSADIESFLALDKDEKQRPRESNRVDFKESLPSDIGNAVASMANADGGLIFIGVKASKAKQNIPVDLVEPHLGSDGEARIANMILATVHPRPPFQITVLPLGPDAKAVALIRVLPGLFPPYEFQHGHTVRIPIRIQDSNRQATLREIEALLERRRSLNTPASDLIAQYLTTTDLYCTADSPTGETRESQFQRATAIPRVPFPLRLDSSFHRAFEQLIRSAFPKATQFSRNLPRGRFYQVEQRIRTTHLCHRIWRIWSDGTIGFVGNLPRRGHPGEYIGDVVLDFLNFCRLADIFFRSKEYCGPVVLSHLLSCSTTTFLPRFPPPGGLGDYDEVPGIHFPDSKPQALPGESTVVKEIDADTLRNPEVIIAETMLVQLQETCGASIKFDSLLEAIASLMTALGGSVGCAARAATQPSNKS